MKFIEFLKIVSLLLFFVINISNAQKNSKEDIAKISIVDKNLTIIGRVNQINLGFGTFFGFNSGLNDDLTDNINSGFGYNALKFNINGSYNTAIGHRSLEKNISDYNSSLGSFALHNNSLGEFNTAIGALTLRENIEGYSNTAIGFGSLNKNLKGSLNTSIGVSSQELNTEGIANTTLGTHSLSSLKKGDSNTSIGVFSLKDIEVGTNNIAIGYRAGKSCYTDEIDLTNSHESIFLGSETKAKKNNSINEIIIGYGAKGGGSNTITLGNDLITNTYLKGNVIAEKFTLFNDINEKRLAFNSETAIDGHLIYTLKNNRLICIGTFKALKNGFLKVATLPINCRPKVLRNTFSYNEKGEVIHVKITSDGEILMNLIRKNSYIIDFEITLNF